MIFYYYYGYKYPAPGFCSREWEEEEIQERNEMDTDEAKKRVG